jgi:alpha-L-fucosidase
MKYARFLALCFILLILNIPSISFSQEDDRGYIVQVGDMAPDFTVSLTDGSTFRLSEQRGKVVMLQFTASWCSVCRREMPHIENEIWQPLKNEDFVLVGLDRDEPMDVVKAFGEKMKITYPLAPDPGADVFGLYALKQAGVTRNVIIGRDGRIVFLTRLYDEKEFDAMKAVIFGLLDSSYIPDIQPNPVIPSKEQIAYQQMEMIGFIHFTMNTFTDKEWGYGDEDPGLFNPTALDAEQWVKVAKAAGMKELILTAKHHDGFCLWPSQYTEHSIKNSPYKGRQGDIVREFTDACRKHGLKVGLYLSPWDRNHKDYGKPEYITYYRNQLRELLTNYGEINELWFDGANGGSGYYGGADEERYIDKKTYYDWDKTIEMVKELQPGILIFSDAGPDIRWVGNENGYAGETFWSTIDRDRLGIGYSDQAYLNTGDPQGKNWITGECDVSIRPGWFYHASEDSLVKTPQQLIDIYEKSVGRNGVLLLNIPPDRRGLIHENDIRSLQRFRTILDSTFATNLALSAVCTASNTRLNNDQFSSAHLTDNDPETYWAADDGTDKAEITLQFYKTTTFNRIVLLEPIRFGQRISEFRVSIMQNGAWKSVYQGTTIGYKRILSLEPVTTDHLKVEILEATNAPAISEIEVY